MIEHHFVVAYNRNTGHYYLSREDYFLKDGTIYDTSTGKFRHTHPSEIKEDANAYDWLNAALTKLSDETTKVGNL